MRQATVQELKNVQLEIMDVVMKFCDEHNLSCFLDGGTLLGAVRHKGYIPWDDDIDLSMLRPDYDKFMKLFNEHNTRYKFSSIESDPEDLRAYGKVADTLTEIYEPNKKSGDKMGINIDIWVLDNAPDDDAALRVMKTRQTIYRKLHTARAFPKTLPLKSASITRKVLSRTLRLMMKVIPYSILPRNYFAYKMIKNARRYDSVKTKRVCSFLGYNMAVIDRAGFESFTYAEFEGRQCKIPAGYDAWLTDLYGDYMTPPPEGKRDSTHQFEAFINEA